MSDKKTIEDARADDNGNIKEVKFAGNKTFTPLDTAIRMAEQGKVDAVVVHQKDGDKYLRTRPDGDTKNNLDTMAGNK
jgi:ABC-type tungstate transport system permease subunit